MRHFFSSEAQESPSSNGAQPEKAGPEHNTSQPPENSQPNANAAEKGAHQTTRHPAWQRRLQQPPNQRTNQLGAAQPPPGKPTESGRKDMHCTHEGQKAEKTGKNTKRQEKTGKSTKRHALYNGWATRPKRGALYRTVPRTAAPRKRQQNRKGVARSRKVIKWQGKSATP